jgi:hypothetical protein
LAFRDLKRSWNGVILNYLKIFTTVLWRYWKGFRKMSSSLLSLIVYFFFIHIRIEFVARIYAAGFLSVVGCPDWGLCSFHEFLQANSRQYFIRGDDCVFQIIIHN